MDVIQSLYENHAIYFRSPTLSKIQIHDGNSRNREIWTLEIIYFKNRRNQRRDRAGQIANAIWQHRVQNFSRKSGRNQCRRNREITARGVVSRRWGAQRVFTGLIWVKCANGLWHGAWARVRDIFVLFAIIGRFCKGGLRARGPWAILPIHGPDAKNLVEVQIGAGRVTWGLGPGWLSFFAIFVRSGWASRKSGDQTSGWCFQRCVFKGLQGQIYVHKRARIHHLSQSRDATGHFIATIMEHQRSQKLVKNREWHGQNVSGRVLA